MFSLADTTKTTMKVGPIDNTDLAGICALGLGRTTTNSRQTRYPMVSVTDLEKIKNAFLAEQEQHRKKGKANPSNSGKRKMVSIYEPIPKMPCKDAKHCALCKKHWAHMQLTNCPPVGSNKKTVRLRKVLEKRQHGSTTSNKKTASLFVQLLAKIIKLEKANEKLKKNSCKHKLDYGSNSNNSNSS